MDWIFTGALLGIIVIGILLIKTKVPVLSFVWGILGIAIAAASLNESANIAFSPWIQLSTAVFSVMLMLVAALGARE